MEFITLNSRITIQKGVINERKVKLDTEEGFTRLMAFVALIVYLLFCIYRIVIEKDYFVFIHVILILVWLTPHLVRIYTSLFIKTWQSSIKLDRVSRVTSLNMGNGLETQVTLHLKNERKKFFVFRNAENQVENFIGAIENREEAS